MIRIMLLHDSNHVLSVFIFVFTNNYTLIYDMKHVFINIKYLLKPINKKKHDAKNTQQGQLKISSKEFLK